MRRLGTAFQPTHILSAWRSRVHHRPEQHQYTAQFGNGVSGTIGLDDPTVNNRTAVYNLSISGAIGAIGTGSSAYAGTMLPTWSGTSRRPSLGAFQISAAAHEVSGSYNILNVAAAPTALSEISGHPRPSGAAR